MLTEVTNFYSAVSWGEKKWRHLFFKDPLDLLVGIHFRAALWSFKKTAEESTGLPQWEEGPPGTSLLHPGWLLMERHERSTLGAVGIAGTPQTCPGCLYRCWEAGFQWGSGLISPGG